MLALAKAKRWCRATDEQGTAFADRSHEEIVGPGLAAGDQGRRARARIEGGEYLGARRGSRDRDDLAAAQDRGPVRPEFATGLGDEHRVEIARAGEGLDGVEGIEARVAELSDGDALLDRSAVDLADFADEEIDEARLRQHDGELVDRDPVAALEHLDPDDVGAERTDARSHEAQRAGPVGEPHADAQADDIVGRLHVVHCTGMTERIGIFGGTFDPPHVGHVMAAAEARHALGLDRLLVVVAGDPWQKSGRVVAAATDRLALARAAFAGLDSIEVSAIEVERAGPTFTIDTVEVLAAPDRDLFLIVGVDAAARLASWHRADDLATRVTVATIARAGDAVVELAGWEVVRVEAPRLDVSSSSIRGRIADGRPIDGQVPIEVCREIRARHLYTLSGDERIDPA